MAYGSDDKHKYQSLETWILDRIADETFLPGHKIPSENQIAEQFDMSRQTVRQAISNLVKKGSLIARRGSGTYVSETVKRRSVGFIATNITDYIFPSIINGMEDVLASAGCTLSLGVTRNRIETEHHLLESFMDKNIDGIIIEGSRSALPNPNLSLFRRLDERGIPYLFVNGFYEDLHPVFVVTDDRGGMRRAVEYLYALGHRRIGGIFKGDDRQGHERYAGYSEALVARNITPDDDAIIWYTTPDLEYLFSQEEELRLLRRLADCSAIVCYNDQVAIRLIQALLRNRIRVPDEKSIIGFDNSSLSELSPVKITTLTHPGEELGREAAKRLLQMMKTKTRAESLVMKVNLSVKDSTKAKVLYT